MINELPVKKIIANVGESGVSLLAASKGRSAEDIRALHEVGVTIFGENYVQEAQEKIEKLKDLDIVWHFIGHLQKNKAKKAVQLFDSIDTVDSFELAQEIDNECSKLNKIMPILLQVNISKESKKNGLPPEQVETALQKISSLENIQLKGLMSIGSKENTPQEFKEMKKLFDKHKKQYKLITLSMGMSNDYKQAIQEGATMVRLGRLLFE